MLQAVSQVQYKQDRQSLGSVARLASLGLYMGVCIFLFTYLGMLGDQKWETGSLITIVGFCFGTAAAFYGLVQEVRRLNAQDK